MPPLRVSFEYEPGDRPPRWRNVIAALVIIVGVLVYLGVVIIAR